MILIKNNLKKQSARNMSLQCVLCTRKKCNNFKIFQNMVNATLWNIAKIVHFMHCYYIVELVDYSRL
jgi:hypothetical protein